MQTGTPAASFTLAVDQGFKDKDSGQRQTDFVDCVAWRGMGEFVAKYFVKGQLVAVTGRLQIRDWTDKDGAKRRNAEVVTGNVYFTGDRRNESTRADEPPGSAHPMHAESTQMQTGYNTGAYTSQPQQPWREYQDDDGDLPF